MPYITTADLEAYIPPAFLAEGLDDDADGAAEAGAGVIEAAGRFIDGQIEGAYTVPLTGTHITQFVKNCAALVAAQTIYARRGMKDSFPFADQLKEALARLRRIAGGQESLLPPAAGAPSGAAAPRGAIITGPMRTVPANGGMAL